MNAVGGDDTVIGTDQFAPAFHTLQPDNFVPVEGTERKPQQPQGRLSESTLKAMLQVQEMEA